MHYKQIVDDPKVVFFTEFFDRTLFEEKCKEKRTSLTVAVHCLAGQTIEEYSKKMGKEEKEVTCCQMVATASFATKPEDVYMGNNLTSPLLTLTCKESY